METFVAIQKPEFTIEHQKLISALTIVSERKNTTEVEKLNLNQALKYISDASTSTANDFSVFLKNLSDVLAGHCGLAGILAGVVRQQSGILLKNQIGGSSHKLEARKAYRRRWLNIDEPTRIYIKKNVLLALGTEECRPSAAAQCIQYIAAAELPERLWPSLISILKEKIITPIDDGRNATKERCMEAHLETLGYVCGEVAEIDQNYLEESSNDIFCAIVHGMKNEDNSNPHDGRIRLAATNALLNSLIFARSSFSNESERNCIMQIVCETTRSQDMRIKKSALECLSRIMMLYYPYLETYMAPALFPIMLEAMSSEEDEVALQAIEFWSSVAEEELDLAVEAEGAELDGITPQNVSRFYAKGALQFIMPILMKTLTKQEELDDDDEWNPSSASNMCISLLASCCKDDVIDHTLPFVETNIKSSDWRFRNAAIQAFGSIIDGPDPETLQPIALRAMPALVEALNDSNSVVKDRAAWTIGRICDVAPDAALLPASLPALLEALVRGLSSETRIAIKICWTLRSVAEAAYEAQAALIDHRNSYVTPDSYALSPFFQPILEKLLEASNRGDHLDSKGGHGNLRTASYRALDTFVCNSPKDCYPSVQQAVLCMFKRLQETLSFFSDQIKNADTTAVEFTETNKFLVLLCSTLHRMFKKIQPTDVSSVSDQAMEAILTTLQISTSLGISLSENAMELLSTLVERLGEDFSKYVDIFLPFVQSGLKSAEVDPLTFLSTMDVVSALAKGLCAKFVPYCDLMVTILLENVANDSISKDLKPRMISIFGDIAVGIKNNFAKYFSTILPILVQACLITECPVAKQKRLMKEIRNKIPAGVNVSNVDGSEDDPDYRNDLRIACLEVYVGVIQGFKTSDLYQPEDSSMELSSSNLQLLVPYLGNICQFLNTIGEDEKRSDSCLPHATKLIGLLCMTFGHLVFGSLYTDDVVSILISGKRSRSNKTRDYSNWGRQELIKLSTTNVAKINSNTSSSEIINVDPFRLNVQSTIME